MKPLNAMHAGRVGAIFLAFNLAVGVLDAMAGTFVALISAVAVVALSVSLICQTRNIRARAEQLRPRPDYARIAELEFELGVRDPEPITEAAWVRTYERGGNYVESLGGTDWATVPLPPSRHHCKAQTRGCFGLNYAERCACGAIRCSASGSWIEKNETRRRRDA